MWRRRPASTRGAFAIDEMIKKRPSHSPEKLHASEPARTCHIRLRTEPRDHDFGGRDRVAPAPVPIGPPPWGNGMAHLLNIHWPYGEEYVPIPAERTPTITTVERWRQLDANVTYTARLEHLDLEHRRFELRYVRDDQTDLQVLDPDNEVPWGRSVITWRPRLRTGTAAWFDDDGTTWEAPIDVLGGEIPSPISGTPFR